MEESNEQNNVVTNDITDQDNDNNINNNEEQLEQLKESKKQQKFNDNKIEILNLPFTVSYQAFLKFLRKKQLRYHKMKLLSLKSSNQTHSFITFHNKLEKLDAMNKLDNDDGLIFRGKRLIYRHINNDNDELNNNNDNDFEKNIKIFKKYNEKINNKIMTATKTTTIDINEQICPLYKLSYDEQINEKLNLLNKMWKKCLNELNFITINDKKDVPLMTMNWFKNIIYSNNNNCDNCEMRKNFIKSPQINGYRNKYEFTIDKNKLIGFRMGCFRDGIVNVLRPSDNCPIINKHIYLIIDYIQKYLNNHTELQGFDPITRMGHYKQLLIRINRKNDCLLSIRFVLQQQQSNNNNDDELLENEIENLQKYFNDNNANELLNIKSIYIEICKNNFSTNTFDYNRLIFGDTHLFETLNLKNFSNNSDDNEKDSYEFRISLTSFFQVNILSAELLYEKIIELSKSNNSNDDTIVLDICCGTGTIGICLAKYFKKIIGIELSEQSIEDAKFNVKHNNIENIEYYCGRAEKLIGSILEKLYQNQNNNLDIVAILDPPRNGLPSDIMKCIRNNKRITRIIYVSCDSMSAHNNFIDLCRPISRAYHREPFVPIKTFAVDLFPHTIQSELIIMFERLSMHQ